MITLADDFRLGVRPEDIISALQIFVRRAKHREEMRLDRALNREYFNAYDRYRYRIGIGGRAGGRRRKGVDEGSPSK